MGVRSGLVGGVFAPVFDPTKTRGGRRAGPGTAPPVINKTPVTIQSAFQQFTATAIPSVTLAATPTAGNTIILFTLGDHGSSLTAPAAATPLSAGYTSGSIGVKAWTLPVIAGMSRTITFQDAGVAAAWGVLFAAEVRDWSGGAPQVSLGAMTGSGTAWNFAEPAPTSAFVLQLGAVVNYQGNQQVIGSSATVLQNAYGNTGGFGCGKLFTLPAGTSGNISVTTPYAASSSLYATVTLLGVAATVFNPLVLDPTASSAIMGQPFSVAILNETTGSTVTATVPTGETLQTAGGALAGTIVNHGAPPDYHVNVSLTESAPGAQTRTTVVQLPVLPHLSALALDNMSPGQGQSWSANVIGLLDVAAISSATSEDGTALTFSGSVISSAGFPTTGPVYIDLTQSCPGADNDGLSTRIMLTVTPIVVTTVSFQAV